MGFFMDQNKVIIILYYYYFFLNCVDRMRILGSLFIVSLDVTPPRSRGTAAMMKDSKQERQAVQTADHSSARRNVAFQLS